MPTIDELKRRRPLNGASFLKAGPAAPVFPLSNTQGEFLVRLLASKNPEIPVLQRWLGNLRNNQNDTPFAGSLQRGIREFHDSESKLLHNDFQRWRKEHLHGYFLSLKTKSRALLHRSACNHPGSVTWQGNTKVKGRKVRHSLTKLRKVCSLNRAKLLLWARHQDIKCSACKHCLPGLYIKPLIKISTSAADLLKHDRAAHHGKSETKPPQHALPSTTQGFKLDPAQRRAIEERGMTVAMNDYRKRGFKIQRQGKPYDILCVKGRQRVFVEVKASQGSDEQIILTKNEVKLSRTLAIQMHLAIVTGICLDKSGRATGGTLKIFKPWRVQENLLTPYAFTYKLGAHE